MRRIGLTCAGLKVSFFFIFLQIISANALCPAPWQVFADHCYAYINHTLHWIDALIFCKNEGADLLEITSEEENSFVASLVQTKKAYSTWIGASRLLQSSRWRKVTNGASQTVFKWSAGNPSDSEGTERCLEMYGDGTWNDLHCIKHFRSFICKG